MPLLTTCASCSAKISVKDDLLGKAIKCPKCNNVLRINKEPSNLSATGELQKPLPEVTRSLDTPSPGDARTCSMPRPDGSSLESPADGKRGLKSIGRYRVEKILGEGGFGIVYLAHDDELKRQVAVKVPKASRIRSPKDAEAYLVEAQILATLDHPHIVPVYDVGRSADGLPFVVSKFIEGSDLTKRIKESRPSIRESAILIARMAEALHYAHQHHLVHRDVKPGNILIDISDKPFLVDFGLALKEEDFGKGSGLSGTPAYMSPEQAKGEGHLVDGRSDIFSLGVVLYELLTGSRPIEADTMMAILMQIINVEPRPPRQIDPDIPKELERITLKALAKKASERYLTALDFADDLKHWLEPGAEVADKGQVPFKIIPKGLRSFDAHDADFFLELLPGPRDREGLPDTLRFWKTRIEETDADKTFRVGVIYGPSGCGKSSFVKAGLLPRLADDVRVVYVEATPEDTETRLLRGLERACPDLSKDLSLREAIAHLRRNERLRQKVVVVVDQFEQWLHGKHDQENSELVQALRQCDGERVQCIVMVRDDFWLAVSRFMKSLEIRVLEGQNSALVDLFDLRHAQKVLTAFGKAYGTLLENTAPTRDQSTFLEQAVAGLAQEGKVISVRLALFAEMVKSKAWTPATLKAMGGAERVGVAFLEETFSATTAPPEHRYHQQAARAILKALLPDQGTDIKGQMQSHADLLEASGYAASSSRGAKEFEELLIILNSEVRLITPTDPAGVAAEGQVKPVGQYYQLTHDYLVPSLRDWLTRKQKETRRGRAELLLEDRALVWNARPENRQLPSLRQWLSIRWLTAKKNWTPPQQKMMARAARIHALRGLVLALLLTVGTITGLVIQERVGDEQKATHAAGLVQNLLDAETAQVPDIIGKMAEYRKWTDPLLRVEYDRAAAKSRQQLHVSLALLPMDATQVAYLYGRLLDAEPHEVPVIRDALAPNKDALTDQLWAVALTPDKGKVKEPQRLRAAAALAKYDPQSEKWMKANALLVNDLVLEYAVFPGQWIEAFRPIKGHLLAPLSDIFRDERPERSAERRLASNILADYAADKPLVLADLLMDADEQQFALLFPKVKEQGDRSVSWLLAEIDKQTMTGDGGKEKLAKRQANAAVALLKMNRAEKIWPLLKHSPDPSLRSYLIHRLHPLGADGGAIVKQLNEEPDITIRRALILSLGEYGENGLSPEDRQAVIQKVQGIYTIDTDPGLHGASEWLLRTWKEEAWLKRMNDDWAKDGEGREKRIARIKELVTKDCGNTPPQSYVNGQGQTMVVIPGPVEFIMGSPATEKGRQGPETERQHKRRIGRTFAVAAKLVTVEQYRQFEKGYSLPAMNTRMADLPVVAIEWFRGAKYCNWLSKEEGLPEDEWCYEIQGNSVKLKENYLSLTGYRLPTEAEMEYATRAGALTSRYFGETEELLPKYAWYIKNSEAQTWPVGILKPNDLGLFDITGNASTWCQESFNFKGYPTNKGDEAVEDKEDQLEIVPTRNRVVRGASFLDQASHVRSANRNLGVPSNRLVVFGFRVARTFEPIRAAQPSQGSTVLLDKMDSLTAKDSGWIPNNPKADPFLKLVSGNPHKVYTLKLSKGDNLVIRLKSKNMKFDPLVAVEDAKKNLIALNDDEDYQKKILDSKLVVTIPDDGEYRIIATCYHEAIPNKYGDFHLTVEKTR